jgi:hypothetical protein
MDATIRVPGMKELKKAFWAANGREYTFIQDKKGSPDSAQEGSSPLVESKYESVADYDPVLRAHCRLDEKML